MAQRLHRGSVQITLAAMCLLWLAGCGGDTDANYIYPEPVPRPGYVTGTIKAPNGNLASANPSLFERLGNEFVRAAYALSGRFVPVGRQNIVRLILRDADGTERLIASTSTNDQGQYQLPLPAGTSADTCRYLVACGPMRAFVTSSESTIDITPLSEAAVRLVLANAGGRLCDYTTGDLVKVLDAVARAPGSVAGIGASDASADATGKASLDPNVRAAVEYPLLAETPTRTPTSTLTQVPTHTGTPSNTATPTITGTPTYTFTRLPTSTPTQTRTATIALPTNTPAPEATDTASPAPTVTATETPVPTQTEEPTPEATPTATETETPVVGPELSLSDAAGAAGSRVTLPVSLQSNGIEVVTISALDLQFDRSLLNPVGCGMVQETSPERIFQWSLIEADVLRSVLTGNLIALQDGPVVECTFEIAPSAPAGPTAVTIRNGNLADTSFNDFYSSGATATITISAPEGPQLKVVDTTAPIGGRVDVPVTLQKNGFDIVTISPLDLQFDPELLTAVGCRTASGVSQGKIVRSSVIQPGILRAVMTGDLVVLDDAPVFVCTFDVSPAAGGTTSLSIQEAGLADTAYRDFTFAGGNGILTFEDVPSIQIGSASGTAGSDVTFDIGFVGAGKPIVTIGRLALTFDPNVLDITGCTKNPAVSENKLFEYGIPESGLLRLVLAGDLEILNDGPIVQCTARIRDGASGQSVLSFSLAEMADGSFGEYEALGSSGVVTIE